MSRTLMQLMSVFVFVLFVGVGGGGQAMAQSQTQAAPSFSDAKLASFIDAAKKVDDVITQWNPKIEGAKTPEDKQKVLGQAEQDAVKAIEKTKGISVDEYRQISQAARSDPQLAAKLDQLYQTR